MSDLLFDKGIIIGDFLPIGSPNFKFSNQKIPDGETIDFYYLFWYILAGEK